MAKTGKVRRDFMAALERQRAANGNKTAGFGGGKGNGRNQGVADSSPGDWRDVYTGGYLKASDVPEEGMDVTIVAIESKTFREGEQPKLVAQLVETDKSLVLNRHHCERLEEIFGTGRPTDWEGRPFEIYNDTTVVFNGIVGGIRIR